MQRRNGYAVITGNTWTRKSIPLALETLVTNPGKVALLGKARAEFEKSVGDLDREYVADYINESFGIPVRKNDKGEFEYFLLKGYVPTADIAKMDAKELLGMLNPMIKAPVEQMLNTDFYRMKPVAKYPGELVEFMGVPMPARMANLLRNVVIMQQIDREFLANEATATKAIASELGVRLQAQDPENQYKRTMLALQMEMGDLKRAEGRAREAGDKVVADNILDQLVLLTARRDYARQEAKRINPDAFKRRSTKEKVEKPKTLAGMKRSMKIDLGRLLGPQKKAE